MSTEVPVCDIDPDLKKEMRKLRFRSKKEGEAIIMKVDKEKRLIILDEILEDCDAEEIKDALPEHVPRFIAYSFCHTHYDGRVSYPLALLFHTPPGGNIELSVMYAGSKLRLVKETDMTKLVEVRDLEDLSEEWLKKELRLT